MPLHLATEQEHQDLIEMLLHGGARVNVVDRDNRTPLMLAARVGQASLVSVLLNFGAQRGDCDNNGLWQHVPYNLEMFVKIQQKYSLKMYRSNLLLYEGALRFLL